MTLQYATAGHPPAIVYRPGHGCIEIESRGRLLGWQDDLQILPGKIDIRPGDRILLYTDGVIEARNPHEELFGIERVSEFLDKTKNDDAQQFLDDLRITLLNWIHPRPSFEDDVTMVVIDVEKSS